jgi:hypothetical protein
MAGGAIRMFRVALLGVGAAGCLVGGMGGRRLGGGENRICSSTSFKYHWFALSFS